MIDLGLFFKKILYQLFGRIKLHKKGSRNIYIYLFYLRKLSRLRGQFSSTALLIDTLCQILRCTNAVPDS